MTFINIHTHQAQPEGIVGITNVFLQDYAADGRAAKGLFSLAIHPWHVLQLKDEVQELLELLEKAATHPDMAALGETGLDKASEAPWRLQKQFFGMQAHLAQRLQKPMIIHCVRAWQEIMAYRKNHQDAAPWIIHGFTGSKQLARQLVDEGFYLSFGAALVKGHQKTIESLLQVGAEHIFMETDDEQISIETVYANAAGHLGVSVSHLQQIIFESFNKLFKTY
ncbi:MAG: TatD family hydrolase [Bacteroidales bacterium]